MASAARSPASGPHPNRRTQDLLWLQRLRQEGVAHLLPDPLSPPTLYYHGIAEFNHGVYWQCHETLEEVWRETPYPLKLFSYALIKVAADFEHVGRHPKRSARSRLTTALANLEPFLPTFLGVRTAPLAREARACLARLAGPEVRREELDALPRPKIVLALG